MFLAFLNLVNIPEYFYLVLGIKGYYEFMHKFSKASLILRLYVVDLKSPRFRSKEFSFFFLSRLPFVVLKVKEKKCVRQLYPLIFSSFLIPFISRIN